MGLPNVPISEVPAPGTPSFPTLDSITVADLVGPQAANRQPVSLDTRSLTLRDQLNLTIEAVNAIDAGPGGTSIFLLRDGTLPMLGHLDMASFRIINLGDPIADSHAVNLLFADNRYVNVTGDEMTGDLVMAHQIPVRGKDSGGVQHQMAVIDGSNDCVLGALNLRNIIESNEKLYRRTGSLYQIWDAGNQGPGTGMNADLLDGFQASQFSRLDLTGVQTHLGKMRSPATVPADDDTTLVTKGYVDSLNAGDRFRNSPDFYSLDYDWNDVFGVLGTPVTHATPAFTVGWSPTSAAPGLIDITINELYVGGKQSAPAGFTTRDWNWIKVLYTAGVVSGVELTKLGNYTDTVPCDSSGTWQEVMVFEQLGSGGGAGNYTRWWARARTNGDEVEVMFRAEGYSNPAGVFFGFGAYGIVSIDYRLDYFENYGV